MSANPKLAAHLAELASMANKCGNAEQARAAHDSLKADPETWETLHYVGLQEYDEIFSLELRNCPKCGSTLAKKISVRSPVVQGAQQI